MRKILLGGMLSLVALGPWSAVESVAAVPATPQEARTIAQSLWKTLGCAKKGVDFGIGIGVIGAVITVIYYLGIPHVWQRLTPTQREVIKLLLCAGLSIYTLRTAPWIVLGVKGLLNSMDASPTGSLVPVQVK